MAKQRKIYNQCTATSKQTGKRCRRSAKNGQTVCYYHGGAKGSGGVPGNTQTLKHGFYSDVLNEGERKVYQQEVDRAKPTTLHEEIALLRVKIRRYCDYTNTDFNFDMWETDTKQEMDDVPVGERTATITRTTKKPLGPDLLIKMLGELRKLLMAKWTMERDNSEQDGKGVKVYRMAEGRVCKKPKDEK